MLKLLYGEYQKVDDAAHSGSEDSDNSNSKTPLELFRE